MPRKMQQPFTISEQNNCCKFYLKGKKDFISLQKAWMAMDGKDRAANDNVLAAQAHIWNHLFSFINSMSLKCAVQLGIPDVINNHGGQPMTLSELISSLPIHPSKNSFVNRLMRILTHSGFFSKQKIVLNQNNEEEEEEEGYVLTDASRLLLKDNPLSLTPFIMASLDPVLTEPCRHFATWFQSDGATPFDIAHGSTFWEYEGSEPSFGHLFNDAMASDARLVTSAVLLDTCHGSRVFEGLQSLVDVGGGTGTVAKAIASAFPEIKCTVFDLPHLVDGLEGNDSNLKYVGGDMFVAVPKADAVLLKSILHDWSDEECVKILKKCKEAIVGGGGGEGKKTGKVILIDMVVVVGLGKGPAGDDDQESKTKIETQLFFDMLMMALVGGRERSEKDWAKLFSDAGFSDYKITPIDLGLRSLIEVYP